MNQNHPSKPNTFVALKIFLKIVFEKNILGIPSTTQNIIASRIASGFSMFKPSCESNSGCRIHCKYVHFHDKLCWSQSHASNVFSEVCYSAFNPRAKKETCHIVPNLSFRQLSFVIGVKQWCHNFLHLWILPANSILLHSRIIDSWKPISETALWSVTVFFYWFSGNLNFFDP